MKNCPIRGCCSHLLQYKAEHGLQTLLTIRKYAELTERGRTGSINLPSRSCMTCGVADSKLFACLSCVHIACKNDTVLHYKTHRHALMLELSNMAIFCCICGDYVYHPDWETGAPTHLLSQASKRKRRAIQLDLSDSGVITRVPSLGNITTTAPVFSVASCLMPDTESVSTPTTTAAIESESSTALNKSGFVPFATYSAMLLRERRQALTGFAKRGNAVSCPELKTACVKGIKNLGNTCYMNGVIQCLLHNPLIRNWCLSDQHWDCPVRLGNIDGSKHDSSDIDSDFEDAPKHRKLLSTSPSLSTAKDDASMDGAELNKHCYCVTCEFIEMMRQLFPVTAPSTEPSKQQKEQPQKDSKQQLPVIVPNTFLCAFFGITMHPDSGPCYNQQDSHEFFLQLIDLMHTEIMRTDKKNKQQGLPQSRLPGFCDCAIHETFSGNLRSVVTCCTCNRTSTTLDPYVSVSLDIATSDDGSFSTLTGCLSQFTSLETLSDSEKVFCSSCGQKCDSTKQISFQTLSNVICFHLKRFNHKSRGHTISKIDQRVEFPLIIDLRPYTFAFRERERMKAERKAARAAEKRAAAGKEDENAAMDDLKRIREEEDSDDDDNEDDEDLFGYGEFEEEEGTYELFGVVCHIGRADGGHYTAYVRSGKSWYFCNDDQVSQVPVSTVLKSQAYMLFYSKKRLCYKEEEEGLESLLDVPSIRSSLKTSSSSRRGQTGSGSGTFSHLNMIIPPRSPHL